MRKLRMAVLAGGATILVASAAMAASHDMHVMKVALPDGGEAQITYQGDVAPKVRIAAEPGMPIAYDPIAYDPFVAFDPAPFAEMDRVAAMMDRQAEMAMQRVATMQRAALAGKAPQLAVAGKMPPGTMSYSFVSTTTSNGGCTQRVEWRSDGTSDQPRMTKTSAGNCAGAAPDSAATPLKAAAPAQAPVAPKTTA